MRTIERTIAISAAKQLIVEGKDADRFANVMIQHLGLDGLQVQNPGGVSELRPFLKALMLAPGNETIVSLGLVRDAEENPQSAFQSASDTLAQAGLTPPAVCGRVQAGAPRVGVFIFPDGTSPGALESLCLQSLRGHAAEPCVRDFLACWEGQRGGEPASVARRHKRELYSFLSYEYPGYKLGEAAAANAFPLDSGVFSGFREFLRQL